MRAHQQPITQEAYDCILQAHHSLQQQNDVFCRNNQTLCRHNDSLMQHIENLYQTIASFSTENSALRRDYEILQTKFNDLKQNDDHGFRPEEKLEKEEENVVLQGDEGDMHKEIQQLNFHSAPITEGAEDQSQKRSFLKRKKVWQVKEKGSLQQDKNEKEKDFNVCDMAVKCKVEKEEAMGRDKQYFEKQILRLPTYHEAIKRTEEDFLKTRSFWEVKEKGTSYQDKDNLKKVDMNIANENLLKSHEKEESPEHINGRVPEEDMCRQELSMNLLNAEVERGLEQDKESVKELENFTDLSDQSEKQEESEYQALLNELEDIQMMIVAQQDLNAILKSNTEEEEDNLEQLKEAKSELDTLAVRNKYLIKDINSEREMTGILHATIGDLEDQCGRLLLMNFLERNKKKDKGSRREHQLEQWVVNRWEDD